MDHAKIIENFNKHIENFNDTLPVLDELSLKIKILREIPKIEAIAGLANAIFSFSLPVHLKPCYKKIGSIDNVFFGGIGGITRAKDDVKDKYRKNAPNYSDIFLNNDGLDNQYNTIIIDFFSTVKLNCSGDQNKQIQLINGEYIETNTAGVSVSVDNINTVPLNIRQVIAVELGLHPNVVQELKMDPESKPEPKVEPKVEEPKPEPKVEEPKPEPDPELTKSTNVPPPNDLPPPPKNDSNSFTPPVDPDMINTPPIKVENKDMPQHLPNNLPPIPKKPENKVVEPKKEEKVIIKGPNGIPTPPPIQPNFKNVGNKNNKDAGDNKNAGLSRAAKIVIPTAITFGVLTIGLGTMCVLANYGEKILADGSNVNFGLVNAIQNIFKGADQQAIRDAIAKPPVQFAAAFFAVAVITGVLALALTLATREQQGKVV